MSIKHFLLKLLMAIGSSLRRKRGPAFGDSGLTQYVGHEVECDGFLVGKTFLAERIEIVD